MSRGRRLPRQRCSPCPQKAPPRSPAAPSCITPSPPSLTATSFLTTPLTPFPLSQALGGQFSARRRPRDPPPSRRPGRNPTPVGGAVTCFSSRLHMCRLHVAAHMSAHVRARGASDACERAEVHSYIVARSSPAAAKVLSLPAKSATAQPSSTLLHNPLTSLPHSNILLHYCISEGGGGVHRGRELGFPLGELPLHLQGKGSPA